MKFGGASVGTATALTQMVSIVLHEHEKWDRLMIVVAALEGVTDALIEAARLAQISNRRGYRRIAATIRTRHLALIDQLPLGANERNSLQADIDQLLFDMLGICQTMADAGEEASVPTKTDAITSVGERLSARIIAALLRQNNIRGVAIDSESIIVTNEAYGHATPDMTLTCQRINATLLPMLEREIVPIITGFIGSTTSGETTTLGRGGSDYTASIVAVCTQANEVWIWAGVDGMMTADPQEYPEANVIPEMSYDEVAEMAYFGARILHPRMVTPLRDNNIPLRIKNVFKPRQSGTLIHDKSGTSIGTIKAVTSIYGIGLSSKSSGPITGIIADVDKILFQSIGIHAEVIITSQSSLSTFFCVVIPTMAGPDAVYTAHSALSNHLANVDSGQTMPEWESYPVMILTLIGTQISTPVAFAHRLGETLTGVEILALSHSPAQCSISLVVDLQHASRLMYAIHQQIANADKSG